MPHNFHMLPKLRDSLSYLYIEHAVIERDGSAMWVQQETGRTIVPVANLCVVLLGPGTSITHAAINLLAEHGCSITWCGEDGTHYYANGMGETHRARHLIRQAELVSNPASRLEVVMRMYVKRFGHVLESDLTIDQVRGLEGVRVRTVYEEAAKKYGVPWHGRKYNRSNWTEADTVNRALSAANAVLHGLCHAAIVTGGYSPGLGFLHTGWHLAFVYDIADLYKTRICVPVAFSAAADGDEEIEKRTRQACREQLREERILECILPDIDSLLQMPQEAEEDAPEELHAEAWWTPAQDLEG